MASDYIVLIFSSIFPLAFFKKINLIKVAAIETLYSNWDLVIFHLLYW